MSKPTVTVTPDTGLGHVDVEVNGREYEARIIVDADARDEDDNILPEDFCLYHMAQRIAELEAERDEAFAKGKQAFELQQRAETEAARLRRENEAAASTIDGLRQRLEQVEAERDSLIEDRARFPDRPDGIGMMINAHFGNLKESARTAKDFARQWHDRMRAAERRAARVESERVGKGRRGRPQNRSDNWWGGDL